MEEHTKYQVVLPKHLNLNMIKLIDPNSNIHKMQRNILNDLSSKSNLWETLGTNDLISFTKTLQRTKEEGGNFELKDTRKINLFQLIAIQYIAIVL
jgi:hypothetical protein